MDWKVGMRAKLVNIGLDSGKEGKIIISDHGTLAFQIDGLDGWFPFPGIQNKLVELDIKWKIGMRARLEKPNYPVMTGEFHENMNGDLVWMSDNHIWFLHVEEAKNYLYLITNEDKIVVEVDCALCQRKNDSGYKTCWWCGTAGQ